MTTTKLILNRLIFFLALLPLAACTAGAQVVYVDCCAPGPGHDGTTWDTALLTIQEGVDAATPGGEVWVADGVYVENVVMGEGVAIYGGFLGAEPGGYETERDQRDFVNNITTIDGNQSGSCVVMEVDARVDGFTVTNGSGTFVGDHRVGGGFYCAWLAETGAIVNNTIVGNSANGGGGLYCYHSSPSIVANTFTGNSADGYRSGGGAIYTSWFSSPSIAENVITANWSDDYGGGICAAHAASPRMTENTISGNSAERGGGVCCWESSGEITENIIACNSATFGGGVFCAYSSPSVADNAITGNTAEGGGGVCCMYGQSSPLIISNTIADNKVRFFGGGVLCGMRHQASPLVISNVVTGNSAEWCGGGICCRRASWQTIVANNLLSSNSADVGGGMYFCEGTAPVVANNTVSANSAFHNGGGICCQCGGHGRPPLANNIVAHNEAGERGGGICFISGPALAHNCFWHNVPDDYYGCEPGEGDISADPMFVDPENGDYHLLWESPCIDAGCNDYVFSDEDFEGDPRIIWAMKFPVPYWPHPGYVDIGADEYVPAAPGAAR